MSQQRAEAVAAEVKGNGVEASYGDMLNKLAFMIIDIQKNWVE